LSRTFKFFTAYDPSKDLRRAPKLLTLDHFGSTQK
jgi:hypothetical protein